jgi:hypothetical protein
MPTTRPDSVVQFYIDIHAVICEVSAGMGNGAARELKRIEAILARISQGPAGDLALSNPDTLRKANDECPTDVGPPSCAGHAKT